EDPEPQRGRGQTLEVARVGEELEHAVTGGGNDLLALEDVHPHLIGLHPKASRTTGTTAAAAPWIRVTSSSRRPIGRNPGSRGARAAQASARASGTSNAAAPDTRVWYSPPKSDGSRNDQFWSLTTPGRL